MSHVIANLDEFEISSDDGVYARVATPFPGRLENSKLRTLTVHGMWVEESVPSPGLERLVLSNVVLHYMALHTFVAANPMLQRVVANCRIENPIPPANATLSLSRLTHLDIGHQTVKLFCQIPMPSLRVLRVAHAMPEGVINLLLRNPTYVDRTHHS
jgi:hypothetical protein